MTDTLICVNEIDTGSIDLSQRMLIINLKIPEKYTALMLPGVYNWELKMKDTNEKENISLNFSGFFKVVEPEEIPEPEPEPQETNNPFGKYNPRSEEEIAEAIKTKAAKME